jgi:pyruvate-formate lyase-activating enzyme
MRMQREAKLKGEQLRARVEEIKEEHREAKRLLPLHPTKRRPQVPKSKLWNREQRQELSKLAEAFLKAKQT